MTLKVLSKRPINNLPQVTYKKKGPRDRFSVTTSVTQTARRREPCSGVGMETATGRLLARHSIRQTLKTVGESDEDGSASATSHSSHAQAGNNHPVLTGPTTLREVLLQIPGVCAFPPWAVTYYALSVLTHAVSAKLCKKSGKAIAPQGTPKEEEHVQFVYWLAVAVFTCVVVMQFAFMVFQISAKKRLLGSLVMFIQLCALITYLSHIYGWIGPISDPGGKEIQITRWLEWMSTTPVMLLVIAAVGNSMRTSLVQSWADTFKMLVLDEIMLLFGLLHSISNNAPWGICCLGLAIVCFIFVFQFIRKVMATSVANAATTYEVRSRLSQSLVSPLQPPLPPRACVPHAHHPAPPFLLEFG